MSEFTDRRDELSKARADQRDAATELARARDRLASLEQRLDDRRRVAVDGRSDEQVEALTAARGDAVAAVERARATTGDRRATALAALRRFDQVADPRRQVAELARSVPLLLFPLRLETRFKRVRPAGGAPKDQLWVRVFPDTCLVDSFEPRPSVTEIETVRRYWTAVWRAAGSQAAERAAWRNLVASHGAGRGRWLSEQHLPTNPGDKPAPPNAATVLLVVGLDDAVTVAERAAVATYWGAAWRAAGGGPDEATARATLVAAFGGDVERVDALRTTSRPLGLDDPPPAGTTRSNATVDVAVAVFSTVDDAPTQSWNRPPQVVALPDRLVCALETTAAGRIEVLGAMIPSPVHVGPDPHGATPFVVTDGDLTVPDELQWMIDFDRAVDDGLGFRIDLPPEVAAAGVDRVTVIGVRLGDGPEDSATLLEELLAHHRDGRGGLAVLRQGTPTNNGDEDGAGFTRTDDADATFDEHLLGTALPDAPPEERLDGRWLADWLGIDPQVIGSVPGAFGTDQLEARAMNVALWPATLGYFLETMMAPVVGTASADDARWFMSNFVSGRGALPAIRIGAQPYGILPAVAFDRLGPEQAVDDSRTSFLRRLLALLRIADADWAQFSRQVRSLGRPSANFDADVLDVLGLHPSSAEMHFRYAQGLDHIVNLGGLLDFAAPMTKAIFSARLDRQATDLLGRFGAGADPPAILDKYFLPGHGKLLGDIIDDRPVSETEHVRVWTTDGASYLAWLATAAGTSLEAVRAQDGFIDDRPPRALLYLLLRHGILLGFHDAAVKLHARTGTPQAAILAMKREPAFVHVAGVASESRWAPLLEVDPAITGDPRRTIGDHIARNVGRLRETAHLGEQVAAIRRLAPVPTARLERLLAEHVDLCSYRFDAWRLGCVHHHVERLRAQQPKGIHVGAYGWLEDLRPSGAVRTPVVLDDELGAVFQREGETPLERDSANGGFIHAPSLDHAITAAVLRAGHLSHQGTATASTLAVNLSSARVRTALSTLEGIRNGQSLSALLGYRLERGLHDRGGITEVDRFIQPLRKAFPLVADRLAPTRTDAEISADAAAARNVVDGLRLVEHVTSRPDRAHYPFGKALPMASPSERTAIDEEVGRLLDLHDALGDLALAEAVHQAAQGRYDAAGAILDTVTTGAHPPDPDVVRTPHKGVALTHRLALHLDPNATAGAGATPRARAEPRLDRWIESVLPPAGDIACSVRWTDPRSGAPGQAVVTMAELGLRPLDLIAIVETDGEQAMTELDDRVIAHVLANHDVPLDAAPVIEYLTPVAGRLRLVDVASLLRTLRNMLRRARPLRPSDATLANEAASAAEGDVSLDRGRVAGPLADLTQLRDDLDAFVGQIVAPLDDLATRRQEVLDALDEHIETAAQLFARAASFGVPQTGWGFAYAWRTREATALVARVNARAAVWAARLTDFDTLLAEFDALPADRQGEERLIRLRRAEISVSATVSEVPPDLADLRAALPGRRNAFEARRATLAAVVASPPPTYAALLASVASHLPLTDVDLEPFDLNPEADRAVAFIRDLAAAVGVVAGEVRRRGAAAAAALTAHDAAVGGSERVDALATAAKAMLGDEAMLVPDTEVPASQAAELANALGASRSGSLTDHLRTNLGVELPVEEWLTGVARVREQARAWEQATIAAAAFGRTEPALTPVQLPFIPGDHWLALPFPDDAALDRDRVLYTAHLPAAFDPAAPRCGLLLDEWTEVVPTAPLDTGIATHFDRPSSEPPNTLLLVVPTADDGHWTWDDVAGALDDTLSLARKRAVEPVHLDATPYGRFLPAIVMATTLQEISIGVSLAANNDLVRFVREVPDG